VAFLGVADAPRRFGQLGRSHEVHPLRTLAAFSSAWGVR
jgi:hypothetical protein